MSHNASIVGQDVMIVTVTGWHDIYRFAHLMCSGQIEFMASGQKMITQLKKEMGKERFDYLDRSMGGWRLRGAKEPKAPAAPIAAVTA